MVKWLPQEFKPLIYKRYVDDLFLTFKNASQIDKFFNYLNNKLDNIKFTKEIENNGVLPFLDVLVNRLEKYTTVYKKPTFTGIYTNFLSFCDYKFKLNLINILFQRAYKICSSADKFNLEV